MSVKPAIAYLLTVFEIAFDDNITSGSPLIPKFCQAERLLTFYEFVEFAPNALKSLFYARFSVRAVENLNFILHLILACYVALIPKLQGMCAVNHEVRTVRPFQRYLVQKEDLW